MTMLMLLWLLLLAEMQVWAQDDEVKNVTFYDEQGNLIGIDPKEITKEMGYVWPDQGAKVTDSKKTNVTVPFG